MTKGYLEPYGFDLPPALIARYPARRRSDARLMIIHYKSGKIEHRSFGDLDDYLQPGDLLVRNRTRVLPARVQLRGPTGKVFEVLFVDISRSPCQVLLRGARRLKDGAVLKPVLRESGQTGLPGSTATPDDDFHFVFSRRGDKLYLQPYRTEAPVSIGYDFFERFGAMPIPPYLDRPAEALDKERYQTVFAARQREAGRSSVAAPTAGLHFSREHIERLTQKGILWSEVQLAIGYGTFAPPTAENFEKRTLHEEWVEIPVSLNNALAELETAGGRLIAVGTTSLRALESAALKSGPEAGGPASGATSSAARTGRLRSGGFGTNIFIFPPYRFRVVSNLLTNFHLPSSSLFMLVCALAGTDLVQYAYAQAIDKKYRFFSYGDACLFLKD